MKLPTGRIDSGTRDLVRLEQMSADWDEDQFLSWAMRGIRRLRGQDDEANAQRPFPPLRLFPSADMFEQFEAAVDTAQAIELQWPDHLETALLNHIDRKTPQDGEEFKNQLYLWRLLSRFTCSTRVATSAAHSLRMCSQAHDECSVAGIDALMDAVVATVKKSAASPTKVAQFFSDLLRSPLSSYRFLPDYLRSWIKEQNTFSAAPDERCRTWKRLIEPYIEKLSVARTSIAADLSTDGSLDTLGFLLGFQDEQEDVPEADRFHAYCHVDCLISAESDMAWDKRGEMEFRREDFLEMAS